MGLLLLLFKGVSKGEGGWLVGISLLNCKGALEVELLWQKRERESKEGEVPKDRDMIIVGISFPNGASAQWHQQQPRPLGS